MPSNVSAPHRAGAIAKATAPAGAPASRSASRRRALATELPMLAPPVALVLAFVVVPILIALYLSLTDWDGFTFPPHFVGASNYRHLTQDSDVLHAVELTLVITVVGTIACNVLGLGVATLLNGNGRVNAFMRVLVFYPYVIGPVILGFLWSSILGANGAINSVATALGHGRLPLLSDPTWATVSVIGVIVWSSFGVNVVIYLAGLQTIPENLLEAARIDGAGPWQTFWRVKLAMLAPTITVNVVLVTVGLLRVYELILALTAGGPAGATQSVAFNILSTSFNKSQLGYGAAQSIVLMVAIVIVTVAITAARRRSEQAVAA
jgi:ABC-type sugar transport system permease subunit